MGNSDLENQIKEKQKLSVSDTIDNFITHIDALYDTLQPVMSTIVFLLKDNLKQVFQLAEDKGTLLSEENGTKRVVITAHSWSSYVNKAAMQVIKYHKASELIPSSFLISLISQFDAFLGQLVRTLSLLYPESLNINDKSITFAQLQNFDSILDAKQYIIEKEIDAFLRLSHAEQFEWLERKYKLPLTKDLPNWSRFIELTFKLTRT